jgi:Mg2+ and Co2+ transporter CorA
MDFGHSGIGKLQGAIMDFFDDLNERLKNSEERWRQIKELEKLLKEFVNEDQVHSDIISRKFYCMEKLLILLIEEFKPVANVSEQAKDIQNDIVAMLDSLNSKVAK